MGGGKFATPQKYMLGCGGVGGYPMDIGIYRYTRLIMSDYVVGECVLSVSTSSLHTMLLPDLAAHSTRVVAQQTGYDARNGFGKSGGTVQEQSRASRIRWQARRLCKILVRVLPCRTYRSVTGRLPLLSLPALRWLVAIGLRHALHLQFASNCPGGRSRWLSVAV